MATLEIVKPVIQDDVEFYISEDGNKRGISQTGCARLCGVNEVKIRRVIASLSERSSLNEAMSLQGLSILDPLRGASLYLDLTSNQQAKVLDHKVVAILVNYFAFEKHNTVAKYSVQKFSSMGIYNWIASVTGYDKSGGSGDIDLLASINLKMGKMMTKLEKLEQIESETVGYRKATVKMPILEKWMKELDAESKRQLLASCETHYTIKEALTELFPGTTMSKTVHRMIALKVGQIINGLTGEAVPKKNTPNGRGFSMKVNSYTSAQLPLIKLCAQSIWLD
jgi:hypothetical protein